MVRENVFNGICLFIVYFLTSLICAFVGTWLLPEILSPLSTFTMYGTASGGVLYFIHGGILSVEHKNQVIIVELAIRLLFVLGAPIGMYMLMSLATLMFNIGLMYASIGLFAGMSMIYAVLIRTSIAYN